MDQPLVVQRRFPSFDFVMDTELTPKDAASRLELSLARQERPKGFAFTDPRMNGEVLGSTFLLTRKAPAFGGSMRPFAEGYFVPMERGSHIYVRVQITRWWWFSLVVALVGGVMVTAAEGAAGLPVLLIAIAFPLVTTFALAFEGSQVAKWLRRVTAKSGV